MRICLDESVLREVVAQLNVSRSLVHKEPTYRRLVLHNQLVESLFVVKYRHLRNERDVIQLIHGLRLKFVVITFSA